jgi:hypothetical protein
VGGLKFIFPCWPRLGRDSRLKQTRLLREERGATRVPLAMPVLLYGRMGEEPFQEHTETINMSVNGGPVPVTAEVSCSQKLVLTNLQTSEELACRVARAMKTDRGTTLAGLEFLEPAPSFWREPTVGTPGCADQRDYISLQRNIPLALACSSIQVIHDARFSIAIPTEGG